MVIELSGVQFGLKSYVWWARRASSIWNHKYKFRPKLHDTNFNCHFIGTAEIRLLWRHSNWSVVITIRLSSSEGLRVPYDITKNNNNATSVSCNCNFNANKTISEKTIKKVWWPWLISILCVLHWIGTISYSLSEVSCSYSLQAISVAKRFILDLIIDGRNTHEIFAHFKTPLKEYFVRHKFSKDSICLLSSVILTIFSSFTKFTRFTSAGELCVASAVFPWRFSSLSPLLCDDLLNREFKAPVNIRELKHARFKTRTATGRENFACQDSGVSHIFILIILMEKRYSVM